MRSIGLDGRAAGRAPRACSLESQKTNDSSVDIPASPAVLVSSSKENKVLLDPIEKNIEPGIAIQTFRQFDIEYSIEDQQKFFELPLLTCNSCGYDEKMPDERTTEDVININLCAVHGAQQTSNQSVPLLIKHINGKGHARGGYSNSRGD